ncbi:GMC oxidoreductase [Pilimelia columellifera]|uniref:GMC oxidoreductase n=1 Tax=Pilimelia columellifera subsp. columellifera TaxID=706583 RepID=A0ABP6B123_9ACTN
MRPHTATRRHVLIGTATAAAGAVVGPGHAVQAAPGAPVDVPALVIGTGYGGSVAALRLALAGHRVTMLEMGQEWNRPGHDGRVFARMTEPDERSMWLRRRTAMPISHLTGVPLDRPIKLGAGVLDRVDFAAMGVYCGVGVGGGSLVNGGMAVRPRRDYLAEVMPGLPLDDFFARHLPLAERELGVNHVTEALLEASPYYQYARLGRDTAQASGRRVVPVPNVYDFAYLEQEAAGQAPGSATANEVIFGNNHGKRDLTKTYLARARATGLVTVQAATRASGIERAGDAFVVRAEMLTADGTVSGTVVYRAPRVFLAAGSLGTTELLLRSRAAGGLTGLSEELGFGWGPNGNTMLGRANHVWQPTGARQSTIPVLGIDNWAYATGQDRVFAEIAPFPAGIDTYLSLYLAITASASRARLSWDATAGRMILDWTRAHAAASVTAVRRTFDAINAKQGSTYRVDLFGSDRTFSDHFTYHPLGGCVLGTVTDRAGRVRGQGGLYIVDGSLAPGSLGVNPFLTITALAEQIMETVLAEDLRS